MGEVETVAKQSHPHNVVNQLYFNEKKELAKKKTANVMCILPQFMKF